LSRDTSGAIAMASIFNENIGKLKWNICVILEFIWYKTETKRLKEAVRRNISRFPSDFMFELTKDESYTLRTQIATLKRGSAKNTPIAIT